MYSSRQPKRDALEKTSHELTPVLPSHFISPAFIGRRARRARDLPPPRPDRRCGFPPFRRIELSGYALLQGHRRAVGQDRRRYFAGMGRSDARFSAAISNGLIQTGHARYLPRRMRLAGWALRRGERANADRDRECEMRRACRSRLRAKRVSEMLIHASRWPVFDGANKRSLEAHRHRLMLASGCAALPSDVRFERDKSLCKAQAGICPDGWRQFVAHRRGKAQRRMRHGLPALV